MGSRSDPPRETPEARRTGTLRYGVDDCRETPGGVVPATPRMAREMAARISPDHAREVRDVGGIDAEAGLDLSFASSLEAYAFVPRAGGAPVFLMGVEPQGVLTGSSVVWMLGSELASRHPAGVLRAARWGIRRAFSITGAERLEQFIPDWYRTGLRFVERLGFRLEPSRFRGLNGTPLWCAVLRRRDLVFTRQPSTVTPERVGEGSACGSTP